MDRKAKLDFDAISIVGLVFSLIGIIYLICGIGLWTHPADAEAASVGKVFIPLGAAFLIIGLLLLLRLLLRYRTANRLLDEGHYVWGRITEIRENKRINKARNHPWLVYVVYLDPTGKTHAFRSRHIYRKITDALIGKQVRIYTTDETCKPYYVDIDAVLHSAIDQ